MTDRPRWLFLHTVRGPVSSPPSGSSSSSAACRGATSPFGSAACPDATWAVAGTVTDYQPAGGVGGDAAGGEHDADDRAHSGGAPGQGLHAGCSSLASRVRGHGVGTLGAAPARAPWTAQPVGAPIPPGARGFRALRAPEDRDGGGPSWCRGARPLVWSVFRGVFARESLSDACPNCRSTLSRRKLISREVSIPKRTT